MTTAKGVPQTGILIPLLYCIYVASIINKLSKKIALSQFSNDLALYCSYNSIETSKSILQQATHIIQNVLREVGHNLSAQKTTLILFHKRNNNNDQVISNKIEDTPNQSSEKVGFLGIIFDTKLVYSKNIENIVKRYFKSLNILKFKENVIGSRSRFSSDSRQKPNTLDHRLRHICLLP